MFVYTDKGYVNLDHVVRARRTENNASLLFAADGHTMGETLASIEEIGVASCPVVQAEPGAFGYGVVVVDDDAPIVTKKQIVAWRILPDQGDPVPVFSDGEVGEEIILPLPGGRFYRSSFGSWHDSLEDAVQSLLPYSERSPQ